jgi:hypothetical protein
VRIAHIVLCAVCLTVFAHEGLQLWLAEAVLPFYHHPSPSGYLQFPLCVSHSCSELGCPCSALFVSRRLRTRGAHMALNDKARGRLLGGLSACEHVCGRVRIAHIVLSRLLT